MYIISDLDTLCLVAREAYGPTGVVLATFDGRGTEPLLRDSEALLEEADVLLFEAAEILRVVEPDEDTSCG